MQSSSNFSYHKITQLINFFAVQNSGSIDKLKALKLIYLSDRYHIRKYGRLITNDFYFAMPLGPVASGTKDILERSAFIDDKVNAYASEYLAPTEDVNVVKSIKNFDNSVLSPSELETINYIWAKYNNFNGIQLSNITHKYPEWSKFQGKLDSGIIQRAEMNVFDFFEESPDKEADILYELTPEEKEAKIEYLKEMDSIESFWNN